MPMLATTITGSVDSLWFWFDRTGFRKKLDPGIAADRENLSLNIPLLDILMIPTRRDLLSLTMWLEHYFHPEILHTALLEKELC